MFLVELFMSMDETIIASLDDLDRKPDEKDPYLIIVAGTHIGKIYGIEEGEIISGRSPDCDIWIEDNTISRKHFRIRRGEGECVVQDLNSTNGTFINNKRIKKPTKLQGGDKIQISKDTIIQFDYFDENRKISEKKRYDLGVRDPTTNAYNKSYFLQRISDEFSFGNRQKLPLSVLMIDIDFFKQINDTYGHLYGDYVLKDVAKILKESVRNIDICARYGGEEFAIVLVNTDIENARPVAERIIEKIADYHFNNEGIEEHMTISAGMSEYPKNSKDGKALIAHADLAMYEVKKNGGNGVIAHGDY